MNGFTDLSAFPPDRSPSSPERLRIAQRATWFSVSVNLGLTLAQLLVGWFAHSQSLIAHGLHSFSDLLSDFLVLYANRKSSHPADEDHPYGHARMETAATLILGASLTAVGIGILWDAAFRLQTPATLQAVEIGALWAAIATVVAKEGLYRYLIRIAGRLHSKLMTANALHTRADAASALVVVAGVGGALLGWRLLDLVAAILMGFMILKLGLELGWGALRELIDEGLEYTNVAAIRKTLGETAGVLGVHALRTRRMAHRALVDAHLQVSGRISVSEGHFIAESARARVLEKHPEVLDVLVHIDAEDDLTSAPTGVAPPPRSAIEALVHQWVDGSASVQRIVLHYLAGRVDVEIVLGAPLPPAMQELELRLRQTAAAHPFIRKLSVYYRAHQNGA
jgi:cation diffusion facilitator family transporter